jgi:hypothetical protein
VVFAKVCVAIVDLTLGAAEDAVSAAGEAWIDPLGLSRVHSVLDPSHVSSSLLRVILVYLGSILMLLSTDAGMHRSGRKYGRSSSHSA